MKMTIKLMNRKITFRLSYWLLFILTSFLIFSGSLLGADKQLNGPRRLDKAVPIGAVPITTGNVWLCLTNYGWIGDDGQVLPSMEYPGGSGNHYLFQGSLWVGGKDQQGNYHVSQGEDNEWFPQLAQSRIDEYSTKNGVPFTSNEYVIVVGSPSLNEMVDPAYVNWYNSDLYGKPGIDDDNDGLIDEDPLDFIDNDGDGLINEDFKRISEFDTYTIYNDLWGFYHSGGATPLGVEIIERTHSWSYSYAENFIIFDFEVVNIGLASNFSSDDPLTVEADTENDLSDVYMAFRYDFDISSLAAGEFWYDDMTEYLASDRLSYGYDGDDPNVAGNDAGENGVSPGYIGVKTLDTSIPDKLGRKGIPTSHNWWTIDDDPSSDAARYAFMANGIYAAAPPGPYDYRFLHSVGPFDLPAGDTLRWVLTTGMGDGIGDRDNPDPHAVPGSLRDVFAFAEELYDAGYLAATPPPNPDFDLTIQEDGSVLIEWSSSQAVVEEYLDPLSGEKDFEGYRIYKSDRTDNIGGRIWLPLASYDIAGDGVGSESGLQYQYVDKDVNKGFTYYYAVTSFDNGLSPIGELESSKLGNMQALDINNVPAENLDNVAVVPNPYMGSEMWDHVPSFLEPYWSKIQFINLPEGNSTIRIYTLTGDFVIELVNDDGDSFEDWNLITRNQADITSGVYMYVVEDDQDRSTIGKFVVLR